MEVNKRKTRTGYGAVLKLNNMTNEQKQQLRDKLNEAFLPQNVECDGGACMGCWKDVVRAAIKMIDCSPIQEKLDEKESSAEEVANKWGVRHYPSGEPNNDVIRAMQEYTSQKDAQIQALSKEVDTLQFQVIDYYDLQFKYMELQKQYADLQKKAKEVISEWEKLNK